MCFMTWPLQMLLRLTVAEDIWPADVEGVVRPAAGAQPVALDIQTAGSYQTIDHYAWCVLKSIRFV